MLPRKLIFLHSPLGWYVPGGDIVLQMYGLQSELDIMGDATLWYAFYVLRIRIRKVKVACNNSENVFNYFSYFSCI